ncbi:hypothetical protein S83_031936 [Arachis hypogaea]
MLMCPSTSFSHAAAPTSTTITSSLLVRPKWTRRRLLTSSDDSDANGYGNRGDIPSLSRFPSLSHLSSSSGDSAMAMKHDGDAGFNDSDDEIVMAVWRWICPLHVLSLSSRISLLVTRSLFVNIALSLVWLT